MKLDIKEIRKKKRSKIVSSEKALKNINEFNWTNEVLEGQKKVIVR